MPSIRFRKVTDKVAEQAAKVTEPESTPQQKAVEIPVGAVLNVADRVTEAVKPYRTRNGREQQLKRYREQAERELGRAEQRGRFTRIRLERQVRERERQVRERLGLAKSPAENGQAEVKDRAKVKA